MTVFKTLHSFTTLDTPDPWDEGTTRYVVLSKNADGTGYTEFGSFTTASEAWGARANYAQHNPTRKFFLRKQRVYTVGPTSTEASDPTDAFRDAFRTGNDALVPPAQQSAYRVWVAGKTTARQAYTRFSNQQGAN